MCGEVGGALIDVDELDELGIQVRVAERAVGHEGVVEVPWVLRVALKREECRDLGLEAVGD